MSSRAASLALGLMGFRNRVINGALNIWQRGTTFTNPAVSGQFYTADRFAANRASDVTGATVSASPSALAGFKNALALQRTAGNATTNALFLFHSCESQDVLDLAGQQVTLSFWARQGPTYSGNALAVQLFSGTGMDERVFAYTGASALVNTTQAITTTWTRYNFTGTMPGNAKELGFEIFWTPSGTAGADDAVYFAGFQLEQGAAATAFEVRPIATEQALCERYYERSKLLTGFVGCRLCVSVRNDFTTGFYWRTKKRITPTCVVYSRNGTANKVSDINTGSDVGTTVIVSNLDEYGCTQLTDSGAGFTVGHGYEANYTADAEL